MYQHTPAVRVLGALKGLKDCREALRGRDTAFYHRLGIQGLEPSWCLDVEFGSVGSGLGFIIRPRTPLK